jgi:hypothetical protein
MRMFREFPMYFLGWGIPVQEFPGNSQGMFLPRRNPYENSRGILFEI